MNKRVEKLFLLFIVIQPLLDLATSAFLYAEIHSLTIGMAIRFTAMAAGIIYLLVCPYPRKRTLIMYGLILSATIVLNIAASISYKSPVNWVEEGKFIFKSCYWLVMLFTYTVLFHQLDGKTDWAKHVQQYITAAMAIIGASILLADITGTSLASYQYEKIGRKGWFFAGNELGAIMAIGLPVALLVAIQRVTRQLSLLYWVPTWLLIYSLLGLGTKVGYGAVFFTLLTVIAAVPLEARFHPMSSGSNWRRNWALTISMLVVVIIYTPFSPAAQKINMHWQLLEQKEKTVEQLTKKHVEENKLEKEQMQHLILSGRHEYLAQQQAEFRKAPMMQKWFGMGYGGNYETTPKMIEMDFYDLFFSFGVIGFLVYIAPLLYVAFSIGRNVWSHGYAALNTEYILIASSIVLGLGIAFIAGHVLTAPAVSLYVAVLLAYLFIRSRSFVDNRNGN
ncbi:O-antigen ligase family protein [Geobacillus thermodenitrificans]|jgi:hypothetical protein|uniref:O-antigen ligase family protein n=1 Tax=Geobacillus thermodenitrificans TaxID=33940 RepID=A0ABY9QCN4_GEOTD|nr:O-antigen ligase family protein [Geobacillus thermodenitrificans]MED3716488.1 O-antigen ligase family protein [Geobacillus thermodenitrificans]PJW19903.1 hypothetical protein CV632_14035 [Geobacillus thermodenitrificans]WMV75971.1 O-antigen ligase family protein [Geobacillus thermodenitrificans]